VFFALTPLEEKQLAVILPGERPPFFGALTPISYNKKAR
jgi:hypothetical protein